MKKQTDDLVKRAKRHESEAFTELMQLYMTDMYKVAYAILMNDEDAADAIGDTILICWEKMNQLVKIQYFKTWMTRILINKCYDIRKKNQNIIFARFFNKRAPFTMRRIPAAMPPVSTQMPTARLAAPVDPIVL